MNQQKKTARRRRLCYWDNQRHAADAHKVNIQRHLKFLPDFDFVNLKSLDDERGLPCDLMIVNAIDVPSEEFFNWIVSIGKRLHIQHGIWTPAFIISRVGYSDLSENLHTFADDNWYFDIVNPQHIDSIPIRVANLLKIHDHLHELLRYKEKLDALHAQVEGIEKKLQKS